MQAGCLYMSFKCFTLGLRYLGEGKKSYVLTKRVKKKIHYCLVWGFSNDL